MIEMNGWNVEGSNWVIGLAHHPKTYYSKGGYQAGAMLKRRFSSCATTYMMFQGEVLDTRAAALEDLIRRTGEILVTWNEMYDMVYVEPKVKKSFYWWYFPVVDMDVCINSCFSTIVQCDKDRRMGNGIGDFKFEVVTVLDDRRCKGYCSVFSKKQDTIIGKDTLMKDKDSAVNSMRMHFISCGAMLEKLQSGAFMAFVSNDQPDYKTVVGNGSKGFSLIENK